MVAAMAKVAPNKSRVRTLTSNISQVRSALGSDAKQLRHPPPRGPTETGAHGPLPDRSALSTLDQPHNRQQHACADEGVDYCANEASADMDSYQGQQIAGDHRADDADLLSEIRPI